MREMNLYFFYGYIGIAYFFYGQSGKFYGYTRQNILCFFAGRDVACFPEKWIAVWGKWLE
jgi:hypothetical protein